MFVHFSNVNCHLIEHEMNSKIGRQRFANLSAVQTPGFSPPAPAKKTPAPGKKLRLQQKTCEN